MDNERDVDFIRDEDEILNGPKRNPYVDYDKLGRVADGEIVYPEDENGPKGDGS